MKSIIYKTDGRALAILLIIGAAIVLPGCESNGFAASEARGRSVMEKADEACIDRGGVSSSDMIEDADDDAIVACRDGGPMVYIDG